MKRLLTKSLFLMSALLMVAAIAHGQTPRLMVKDDMDATKLVITKEGQIGINTTTPQMAIDLGGGGITVNGNDATGTRPPRIEWVEEGRMDWGFGGNGGGNLQVYGRGRADNRKGEFRIIYGGGPFGAFRFLYYDGSTWNQVMTLNNKKKLLMWDGAWCDGRTWFNGSSRESKENIRELSGEEAIRVVSRLEPVTFNYKNDRKEGCVGFIAEDLPDLVATKGRKSLSAVDIVAVLTKAVQEQQKTIAALSRKVEALERELRLLTRRELALAD